jgi:hypothetical protein
MTRIMKHERHLSERGVPTTPYLVYLPDGKTDVFRSATAQNAWAVAKVTRRKGGWSIDAVHNTAASRLDNDTVATAERITEEEAIRYFLRDQTEVRN